MAVSEKTISDKIETSSIVKQLEKEIEENGTTFDERYSHKEDLEKLLNLAEDLKEKCDKTKNGITNYRILQITGTILFITSMLSILLYYKDYADNYTYLIIFIELILLMFVPTFYRTFLITNNFGKQYMADKLALSEVLQLLRETSNVIAEQEEWSVLSRAEFRIRLSRLNLEETSKSAFNFFS